MALKIYNTLSSQKEVFQTQEPGHARIYVCGPTVYDYSHIGHARSFLVYDILVRHLRQRGSRVTYVRNVTDVNDRIYGRAKELGEEPLVLAERFYVAFKEDVGRLGLIEPDVEPKVSGHLPEIVALIEQLIDKGHAYESQGDVYFSVASFPGYGKLSHKNLEDLVSGASERTDAEETKRKRDPADFALWKKSPSGEQGWKSPFGNGRPGWHIECSAMSLRHLGPAFDLHGGGLDLVFPHHENELAQSECATGQTCAHYWVHNGFVQVQKEKMGKSLGNYFLMRQAFDLVEPEAVRYAMLTVHYRAPLNFDWSLDDAGNLTGFPLLNEAEARLEYIYATRQRLEGISEKRLVDSAEVAPEGLGQFAERFSLALDDDLNTPIALSHLAAFLKQVNELCDRAQGKQGKMNRAFHALARQGFQLLAEVLGIGGDAPAAFAARVRNRRAKACGIDPVEVDARLAARNEARQNKDYSRSDAIRDELLARGVELYDSPQGTDWRLGKAAS